MSTHDQSRRAHGLLDDIFSGYQPDEDELNHLRSFLPELPKQKTLEEIIAHVYEAWVAASGDEWGGDGDDPNVAIEDWLAELQIQLEGLEGTPANTPALPAGMRIAEHEKSGRCVVSPKAAPDGTYLTFFCSSSAVSGSFWCWAHRDSLTFIDSEPAHPEFLATEADYENAPDGTIVAVDKVGTAWIKTSEVWHSTDGDRSVECPILSVGTRRVLRWGWGNE